MQTMETILDKASRWSKERKTSMLEITCVNQREAKEVQANLSQYGYKGFITHFGAWIGVVLYLNDN